MINDDWHKICECEKQANWEGQIQQNEGAKMRTKLSAMMLVILSVFFSEFVISTVAVNFCSTGVGLFVSGFWWGLSAGALSILIIFWVYFKDIAKLSIKEGGRNLAVHI